MNSAEYAILDLTALIWNKYLELDRIHPEELTEFRQTLHSLQRMILCREAERKLGAHHEVH